MLRIRPYTSADCQRCLNLFRDTIRRVNAQDYSPQQIAAWASPDIDPLGWDARFAERFAYVAQFDSDSNAQLGSDSALDSDPDIVGFVDMTPTGYLDRLFVCAAHQRQGIATSLIAQVLCDATRTAIPTVTADVSITAVPFFARMGFCDAVAQSVECRGARFTNFRMAYHVLSQG